MDETLREITSPIQLGKGWVIGWVTQIHEKGKEQTVQITEHELEVLVEHWSNEIKWIKDEWDYYGQTGSTELRLQPYARHRLRIIGEVIGHDRVFEILERVNKERFLTGHFEVSNDAEPTLDGAPRAPEARVLYTERGRCIVFHHSRAGLRFPAASGAALSDGWCWQKAADFKDSKPVEHGGFPAAEAALDAAQTWEDAYFEEVERKVRECD